MEGFTLIDAASAVVIAVSALLAYSRGFVREGLAIAGWIFAAVLAFGFAHLAEPLVKEIPVVGVYLAESCELAVIAAFAAVFAVALVALSLVTPFLSSLVKRSALVGLDQGLGLFFGVLRGLLLVAVALVAYDIVMGNESVRSVDDSRTVKIFDRARQSLNEQISEDAPTWIVARYEQLVGECGT